MDQDFDGIALPDDCNDTDASVGRDRSAMPRSCLSDMDVPYDT
jgi:hypothetical protein